MDDLLVVFPGKLKIFPAKLEIIPLIKTGDLVVRFAFGWFRILVFMSEIALFRLALRFDFTLPTSLILCLR